MAQSVLPQNVTIRQENAARLLATGLTVAQVSAETGIPRRTLTRWRSQREFSNLVNSLRLETHEAVMSRLIVLQVSAVNRLSEKLAVSLPVDDLRHSDQLQAVRICLETASRAVEQFALLDEVQALRSQVEALLASSPAASQELD